MRKNWQSEKNILLLLRTTKIYLNRKRLQVIKDLRLKLLQTGSITKQVETTNEVPCSTSYVSWQRDTARICCWTPCSCSVWRPPRSIGISCSPGPQQQTATAARLSRPVYDRHGTGSLGHRVNGSFESSFTSGSWGHRVIILTRCEAWVFSVFEKMPKMQNVHLKR